MKTIIVTTGLLLIIGFAQSSQAQSTTGGRSGGSTASTGTGYLTEGQRVSTSNASSMTIADEGASRAYMYVPPTAAPKVKNQAASPDGSGTNTSKASPADAKQGAITKPKKATGKTQ